MKEIFRKLFKLFLTLLVILNSFAFTYVTYADDSDLNEEFVDKIQELGSADEIFPYLDQSEGEYGVMPTLDTYASSPIAFVYMDNDRGYDWISYMYVDGNLCYCIEPMALFKSGLDYSVNTTKWDDLSESQRQAIWEINYYGYSYEGHQTDKYYMATQILIWEVVDQWYDVYEMDRTTPIDISDELNTINSLRSQPKGRPSFNNTTIKTGLNIPMTLTDSKGTLSQYNIHSGNGVNVSANGNDLTVTITSENYDHSLSFSKGYSARDVHIIYGQTGYQSVIYMATRKDPTTSFKINLELLYADIQVEKQDKETGTSTQGDATFNGATFAINDTSGNTLETITTNGSTTRSRKYPIGTSYDVCEISPPTGYLLNSECNRVDLTFNGDSTPSTFYTTISDQVIKGRIEIAKTIEQEREKPYESVISKPGVGFVFDIYLKSSGEKVATLTTDEEGRAISELLPYGTYIVKEQAKEGYDTLDSFEVFIEKDQKVYFYNIYNDTLKAEINIYKTDTETGKRIPAAGVEFKIKDSEGNYVTQTVTYPKKYTTDTFITDEEGSVHLPEPLVFGNYSIVEITAPYGYVLKDTEIPINVDGTATEIFMNFDNKTQKGQVYVEKYGEVFTGATSEETDYGTLYTPTYTSQYLDGVTYEITAREDIVTPEGTIWFKAGEIVDTFTTLADSVTTSALLQLGSYSIKEISTKEGYVLDTTSYDFDIEYAGQLIDVVEIKQSYNNERQKLNLDITKTFEDNPDGAYKDVLFGIYTKEDFVINDELVIPKDGLVGTITIDENGKNIEQYDLPIGDYYIKELTTGIAFKLDEEEHNFTFAYTDTSEATVNVSLNLNNEKRRLNLEVNKIDANHNDYYLNGAIFEVYDKTLNKYVTTLCTGNLMIKGDVADEEYEISKDKDFSEIIKVVKTDSNKEIILDLDDGTYYSRKTQNSDIENAEDTRVITEHIVKDGKATLVDAIYGHEYEFKEIKAPVSYKLADTSEAYKVEADKDTDTVIYYFKNYRIEVPNTGI